jgi:hypothetical protein
MASGNGLSKGADLGGTGYRELPGNGQFGNPAGGLLFF